MKIGCFGMSCAVDSALSQHVMHRTTTLFSAPESRNSVPEERRVVVGPHCRETGVIEECCA